MLATAVSQRRAWPHSQQECRCVQPRTAAYRPCRCEHILASSSCLPSVSAVGRVRIDCSRYNVNVDPCQPPSRARWPGATRGRSWGQACRGAGACLDLHFFLFDPSRALALLLDCRSNWPLRLTHDFLLVSDLRRLCWERYHLTPNVPCTCTLTM